MTTCKNCAQAFEGNFCNNCGQKAKTARLDWKYLADEAKYTFLHFNGGLTYTLKQLVTRPGHSMREFIEGKRVHHYKPILLLFVLAGIYGILMHYLDMSPMFKYLSPTKEQQAVVEAQTKMYNFIVKHYSLFEVMLVPVFSFASWLGFKKYGYNYIENVIINCFVAALRLVFNIATFPLMFWSVKSGAFIFLQMPLTLIGFGLTVWAYVQLYASRPIERVLLRFALMSAISAFLLVIVFVAAGIAMFFVFPENFPRVPKGG